MQDLSPLVINCENLSTGTVFSVPHSGRAYPTAFVQGSLLDGTQIRSSEDAFVDDLFVGARERGAAMLIARAPRAYVDLNRSATDLDPALIEGVQTSGTDPRVTSGLGVIPRVVSNGRPIRSGKMSLIEAQNRLDAAYHPYHGKLKALLSERHLRLGRALLFDCHSMPKEAVANIRTADGRVPDIVLGDRFGASCAPDIMDNVEQIFEDHGFAVMRNTPFAGVDILRRYGRPAKGQHAVQIEINRGLYWEERALAKTAGFEGLQTRLRSVVEGLVQLGQQRLPLAAE